MPLDDRVTDRVFFDLRFTLRILLVTDGAIGFWDTPLEPARGQQRGLHAA